MSKATRRAHIPMALPEGEAPLQGIPPEAVVELELAREELRSQNEELNRARLALEQQRQRYHELFDLAPDMYLLTDRHGTILEANRAAFNVLGINARFLVGKPLAVYVAPDARRDFRSRIANVARRPTDKWSFALVARDGRVIDVAASISAELGGNHEIRWLLRDVTDERTRERTVGALNAELEDRVRERTRALEEAMQQNELLLVAEQQARARLAALMARLLQGVITIRPDLTVEYANRAAVAIVGDALVADAPLPDPWDEFELRDFAASLFSTDQAVVERELHLRGADADAHYTARGLPGYAGSTAVIILTDVTERERRERIQRDFVTNAAHELQTPLAAIVSATDVLQSGAKEIPEQRDRFLLHVEREAARLVRLTRALLALARMQALREAPPAAPLDMSAELQSIAETLGQREGVELEVDCPPGVRAYANRELVEQVVLELATNAVKHASGQIVLRARRRSSGTVEVEVRDSGPGIGGEAERLFERFYRSRDGDGDGFGLGLAIVNQIVNALGGEIDVDSSETGTTVRFAVPPGGTTRT
jgi:PAS domain S-box-containing protein